jgi:molybdopterin-synthase adenylyltransferase
MQIQYANKNEKPTSRQELIPNWSQENLRDSVVVIVGVGAIGVEFAKNLALSGVGHLILIDFDTISLSNLSRTVLFTKEDIGKHKAMVAATKLKELATEETFTVDYIIGDVVHDVGDGILTIADLLVGCVDNAMTRKHLSWISNRHSTPYIDGSINGFECQFSVHKYPESSCYFCSVSPNAVAQEKMVRFSCDDFKRRSFEEQKVPTTQNISAEIAARMSNEAVKILFHNSENFKIQYGNRFRFNGRDNTFENIQLPTNPECLVHDNVSQMISTSLTNESTLKELFDYIESNELFSEDYLLDTLDTSIFVIEAFCKKCGKSISINKPKHRVYADELYCDECINNHVINEGNTHYISKTEFDSTSKEFLNFTLMELGIPPFSVLKVTSYEDSSKSLYVILNKDIQTRFPHLQHLNDR